MIAAATAGFKVPRRDAYTRSAPTRDPRVTSAEAPCGAPRALGQGLARRTDLQQQATSVPMPRAAAARQKTSAQDGSGVPCPLQFPQRPGVRDGQKHLPDFTTPATTDGYPGAINDRKEGGAGPGRERLHGMKIAVCGATGIRHPPKVNRPRRAGSRKESSILDAGS